MSEAARHIAVLLLACAVIYAAAATGLIDPSDVDNGEMK